MKLKISNTDTFEISGTLIISDFKEAGILKVMVVIINYYLILIWIMKKE